MIAMCYLDGSVSFAMPRDEIVIFLSIDIPPYTLLEKQNMPMMAGIVRWLFRVQIPVQRTTHSPHMLRHMHEKCGVKKMEEIELYNSIN